MTNIDLARSGWPWNWREILRRTRRALRKLANNRIGVTVTRLRPSVCSVHDRDRVSYQKRFVKFDLCQGQRVLDIGTGGYPFPYATLLVDRFPHVTSHRHEALRTDTKQLVIADMDRLPFADKYFDYVYCSHVLEHAVDPIRTCREIMRVGNRGYVETPTLAKDMLFAWAKDMHNWHVVGIGQTLCFFEYSARQLEGIRSDTWKEIIFSRWWHPLQDVFDANQDLFNVMFTWSGGFTVMVFYLDGRTENLQGQLLPHQENSPRGQGPAERLQSES